MAFQMSICSTNSGKMVWALCSRYPYWPSIVYPVDSGDVPDVRPNKSVYVKFCASNRNGCWVKLENTFEFNGHESFVAKKRSMKTILSEDDFKKAFETENNEGWREAVIEATFIMSKELDSRLIVFDTLKSMTELNMIASRITFEDLEQPQIATTELLPQTTENFEHRLVRRSDPVKKSSINELAVVEHFEQTTSQSKGPSKSVQKGRRYSQPPALTKQSERRVTRSSTYLMTKFDEFQKDLLTYLPQSYPKKILFENVPVEKICKICCSADPGNDGNLTKCSGCSDHFHIACSNNNNETSYIEMSETEPSRRSLIRIRMGNKPLCTECPSSLICFACKEASTTHLKQCNVKSCGRYYHINCLENWNQADFKGSMFKCPLHVCHTCFSIKNDLTTTKFTFCVKCPIAYHIDSCCIPAGTIILTENQHICIRHRCEVRNKVPSLDWCFRCGEEDNVLVCCVSCPKTYHMSCLNSSEFPDPFLCESCLNGKHPLYGEMVLAKYGTHHWWPAIIVPSFKIPNHMHDNPPNDHEFCIRFFGDYTFAWIGRSSVCFYSKSNATKFLIGDVKQNEAFKQAANWFDKVDCNNNEIVNQDENEAQQANNNEIINSELSERQPTRQPPKYIKINTISQVAPARLIKSKDEPFPCSCRPDHNDPCGPSSDCENRDLYIECNATCCPSGTNCNNQCFERKLSAAVNVVFIDENKGFGLIAEEFICAGTFVIEYVGELINGNEFRRRQNDILNASGAQRYYFMTYSKGLYIDAARKGNRSRFVNHSCDPNCQIQKWSVKNFIRIGYFAMKDIEKGTEITVDYGFTAGDIQQKCFCGAIKCKGVIE